MTATDGEALRQAFEQDPFGKEGKLPKAMIYADYLEDQGRTQEADAVRWMLANEKRPRRLGPSYWYDNSTVGGTFDPESDLPTGLFVLLDDGKEYVQSSTYRRYKGDDGFRQAVADLAQALSRWDGK